MWYPRATTPIASASGKPASIAARNPPAMRSDAKERGKCRSFARSAASMRSKRTAFMYSLTPAQSGNPGMRAWQNSTNASFAAITTGVVGHSVSSRSKVMTSMGRPEPARADVDARAALRDAGDARETPHHRGRKAASPAATSGA